MDQQLRDDASAVLAMSPEHATEVIAILLEAANYQSPRGVIVSPNDDGDGFDVINSKFDDILVRDVCDTVAMMLARIVRGA